MFLLDTVQLVFLTKCNEMRGLKNCFLLQVPKWKFHIIAHKVKWVSLHASLPTSFAQKFLHKFALLAVMD